VAHALAVDQAVVRDRLGEELLFARTTQRAINICGPEGSWAGFWRQPFASMTSAIARTSSVVDE
jgi:hypothetical protein